MSREKQVDKHNKKDKKSKQEESLTNSVISIKEALRNKARSKRKQRKIQKQSIQIKEETLRQSKLQNVLRSLGIAAMLVSALLVYDQHMTNVRIQEANNTIKIDMMWMRRIDNAIIAMRTFEDKAREKKKEGEKINLKQFNVDRLDYLKKVADANSGVNKIVGMDIDNSTLLLNRFDESVPNIFAKNTPSDSAWRNYQIRNEFLFGLKIQEQKEIIIHEQQFVLTRFFEDTKFLIKKFF